MPDNDYHGLIKWFRHSSPYINSHRGKTFVLNLPGEAVAHENIINIVHDIALLASFGIKLVLVHGAAPQILHRLQDASDADANMLNHVSSEQIWPAVEAIGATRAKLEALFSTGLANSPMHNADLHVASGNYVVAMPLGVIDGFDHQLSGQVRRIRKQDMLSLLQLNTLLIVSPLGFSPTGECFYIPENDIATAIASSLTADKLLTFVPGSGLIEAEGEIINELPWHQAKTWLDQTTSLEYKSAVETAYKACQSGVARTHLVTYEKDGALLQEMFTRDGLGTMIYRDHYEQVRAASIKDVGGILELIAPLEDRNILVRRSRELLETEINHFTVVEKDGAIVACAALYPFEGQDQVHSAELACVVTHDDYQGKGFAGKLLSHIELQARQQAISELFVLTTQAAHWFQEHGFLQANVDKLPVKKRSLYNYQRNSKVFSKSL